MALLGALVPAVEPAWGAPGGSEAASSAAAPPPSGPSLESVSSKDPRALFLNAQKLGVDIDRVARLLSQKLREARQARDVVREVCLDDKLNQADAAAQIVTERLGSMKAALAAKDRAAIARDFVMIAALARNTRELAQSADQCIGEETPSPLRDAPPLQVTFDPEIPTQETTGSAVAGAPLVLPPTAAIVPPAPVSRVM